jgi:hypothetical protein
MILNRIYNFILIMLVLVVTQSKGMSDASFSSIPSLSWQRQKLDNSIRETVRQTLSPILKSNEYIIHLDIQTSIPQTPDFYTSDIEREVPEELKSNQSPAELRAQQDGISVAEAERKLEDEKREQETNATNARIRFSDEQPDESADNYIVFSKFGIIAPLIDDFNDFRPDGKILLTMDSPNQQNQVAKEQESRERERENRERMELEFRQKEMALQNQLKDIQQSVREPSIIEQTWKYNQTIDIFSNLRSVKLTVLLNDKLHQETRDSVERALNSATFSLGNITPTITIDYIPMVESFQDVSMLSKVYRFLEKFHTALGLVLMALIFAVSGFLLLKKFEKMKKQAEASQLNMNGRLDGKSENESESEGDSAADGGGLGAPGEADLGLNGIERFHTFFEKSSHDAIILIKKWIQDDGDNEKNALRAVVQQLDNSILVEVFKRLSEEERSKWKSLLSKALKGEQLSAANRFISNQVVEQIILPNPVVDEEVCDLLLKITPQQGAELIKNSIKDGAILMNVMSVKFVNQIFDLLNTDTTRDVIDASLMYSPADIPEAMPSFKKALMTVLDVKTAIPFLARIKEIIININPSREELLYRALGSSGEKAFIIQQAMKRFPASLVLDLPENCLKSIFTKYSISERVEFLLSLDESKKESLMAIVAPEGSKGRDMLDLEFSSAESNLALQKKLKHSKAAIFDSFVYHVRKFLEVDRSYDQEISEVIDQWVNEISREQSHANNVHNLKSA